MAMAPYENKTRHQQLKASTRFPYFHHRRYSSDRGLPLTKIRQ